MTQPNTGYQGVYVALWHCGSRDDPLEVKRAGRSGTECAWHSAKPDAKYHPRYCWAQRRGIGQVKPIAYSIRTVMCTVVVWPPEVALIGKTVVPANSASHQSRMVFCDKLRFVSRNSHRILEADLSGQIPKIRANQRDLGRPPNFFASP